MHVRSVFLRHLVKRSVVPGVIRLSHRRSHVMPYVTHLDKLSRIATQSLST